MYAVVRCWFYNVHTNICFARFQIKGDNFNRPCKNNLFADFRSNILRTDVFQASSSDSHL